MVPGAPRAMRHSGRRSKPNYLRVLARRGGSLCNGLTPEGLKVASPAFQSDFLPIGVALGPQMSQRLRSSKSVLTEILETS